ncbi:MAG: hypothetical protein PHE55_18365 [Methylococcaceae bacterium]|nr:hypothetical protein [Methylococcaceae bacterium]
MDKHWKNFLDGARQVLVLWPGDDYLRPQHDGFLTDYRNLRGDSGRVTKGLRETLKQQKHGKTHDRKSA